MNNRRTIDKEQATKLLMRWEADNDKILDEVTLSEMTVDELQTEILVRQSDHEYSLWGVDRARQYIVLGSKHEFELAFNEAREAINNMSLAWEHWQSEDREGGMVDNYPEYLPSFDEFAGDFANIEAKPIEKRTV